MIEKGSRSEAQRCGKLNHYCKMKGGFIVARLSNGTYDWFPLGQPPHINGNKDDGARIVEHWSWDYRTWRIIGGEDI